ncbi:MAG: RNA polymerase factor sigma-54 [Bryobacterales bacterium]|nr:RNA polymerase factor sigma-54 [Acidobacteriota bacterium]MCB9385396.1 RNA polymerase factor sigma-54 [Bryobacterales bacterium]
MYLQQRIGLKLAQKPVLTQSLRQLVKLLALNKLDLKEEIQQELLENPVLEISAENSERETSLQEAVEIEAQRNGADRASSEGTSDQADASEGDHTEPGDVFNEIDLGQFFEDYLDPGPRGPAPEVIDKPTFETFLSSPVTLTDHLLWQLSLTPCPAPVQAAAEAVIGNLNEDGYLTVDVAEIAHEAGVSEAQATKALELVQQFDPLGVAGRDLQDCLLIQLRATDADKGVAGMIVEHCWDEMQEGQNVALMAQRLGRPASHIEIALHVIRGLDPRPGQRYNGAEARAVEPDVQFAKTPEGFRVVLNDDDMPELRLNRSYRNLLKRGEASGDVRSYIKERYNSAIQLLRNIEQRRQTIRSVCESIVKRQPGFLAQGLEHLRPMMIKDVAEEIGVHASTVSRAVANKYALTPHGVYELRFFFSEGVQGPSGDSVPLLLLKRKVKRMIEEEDPRKPLTDDALSKMLREDGIHVTRRTVAKYREDMNIPSTHKRRRREKGKAGRNGVI